MVEEESCEAGRLEEREKEKSFWEMLEESCDEIVNNKFLLIFLWPFYIGLRIRKKVKEINERIADEEKENFKGNGR